MSEHEAVIAKVANLLEVFSDRASDSCRYIAEEIFWLVVEELRT